MTIVVEALREIDQLRAAVRLQRNVLGDTAPTLWQLPQLLHVLQSGGVVLGAQDTSEGAAASCHGLLVDMIANVDGYPARRSVAWIVDPRFRNRGIGTRLREFERTLHQKAGVDLVYWDLDPLRSEGLHVSLNTLGCIATDYVRDALGSVRDTITPGLATDRFRMEWWIDSPRVIERMERGLPPSHLQVGLHEMTVITKTTLQSSQDRASEDTALPSLGEHVLTEIPASLTDLAAHDRDAAIQWRLRSREVFELLFQRGYVGIGLIHEGRRSFVLFKRGTRKTELSAAARR